MDILSINIAQHCFQRLILTVSNMFTEYFIYQATCIIQNMNTLSNKTSTCKFCFGCFFVKLNADLQRYVKVKFLHQFSTCFALTGSLYQTDMFVSSVNGAANQNVTKRLGYIFSRLILHGDKVLCITIMVLSLNAVKLNRKKETGCQERLDLHQTQLNPGPFRKDKMKRHQRRTIKNKQIPKLDISIRKAF